MLYEIDLCSVACYSNTVELRISMHKYCKCEEFCEQTSWRNWLVRHKGHFTILYALKIP